MSSSYIYDRQEDMIAWAADRMHFTYQDDFVFAPDAKAIGHMRDGEFVGVVVFDRFSDRDCLLHIVSDGTRRWLTREFITRALTYPFRQCGNRRVTCLVSENNKESLRFTRKFGGWVEEGRMREAAPDGSDLIMFGMLRRECPWLPVTLF